MSLIVLIKQIVLNVTFILQRCVMDFFYFLYTRNKTLLIWYNACMGIALEEHVKIKLICVHSTDLFVRKKKTYMDSTSLDEKVIS